MKQSTNLALIRILVICPTVYSTITINNTTYSTWMLDYQLKLAESKDIWNYPKNKDSIDTFAEIC